MTEHHVYEEYLGVLRTQVSEFVREMSEHLTPHRTPNHNYLGDDVDAATLKKIERSADPKGLDDLSTWEQAQIRELAFWRWTAFEGYQGLDPRTYRTFQSVLMMRSFMATGWSMDSLRGESLVEIGCGPLGMVEYLPAAKRVGFDPLNEHYGRLFSKARSADVDYITDFDRLVETAPGTFDVAICFNVLDHTDDPRSIFDGMMRLVRPGGRFLIQVNTVRDDFPRTPEHESMHPSPFSTEKISSWIDEVCDQPASESTDTPSVDNEFWYMAWGQKKAES